ncbi:uncharacterized protein LOC109720999 isoform X2 [Ananas comosus]|uniref:Uncharacterized protein LOC109720999 isoform X2 n=1 Tax=Ananas comosus TaxID=4615 RepID=A0A6P5G832_ANACO|nr:uncharacterized protein LOC109720999 isoform X2 [Ananas comosus]
MSQYRPTQHQGVNDMQLWQQHLMYKQLHEIQKQQQLQQLDLGGRPQNSLNPPPATSKPTTAFDQFPAMLNEMSTFDGSSYMWQNNSVGSELKSHTNPQMFISGNTNWAQFGGSAATSNLSSGVMLSNSQAQAMRSMGFIPQQLDQSFYGMPVSGTSSFTNQHSQLLGMSNDCGKLTQVQSGQFNSFQTEQQFSEQGRLQDGISNSVQNFQGKCLFGTPVEPKSSFSSGNPQQVNHQQHGAQIQSFQGMKDQSQEKLTAKVGSPRGGTSLDPTEEKLLFGTDNDDNWGASFGRSINSSMGVDGHGNPLENDYFGAFPSLQSGSWSALMQEAVQATSSDNGLQEEWSGLSFQRPEHSIANHSAASNDKNLQIESSLTLRHFPSSNDADGIMNNPNLSSFQHPFRSGLEQKEIGSNDSSCTPVPAQRSPGEANAKQFYQRLEQKQSDEGGIQVPKQLSDAIWAQHTHELSSLRSGGMQFKSQNTQGVWVPQQRMFFQNVTSESGNKPNGWDTNNSVALSSDNTSSIYDNDGNMWKNQNNVNPISGLGALKSGSSASEMQNENNLMHGYSAMMNSNAPKMIQDMNRQVISRPQVNHGTDQVVNTSGNSKVDGTSGGNQPIKGPHGWESSINNAQSRFSDNNEAHRNVVSNEGQPFNSFDSRQHMNSGFSSRGSSLLAGTNVHSLGSGGQKSSNLFGQQTLGSHLLQKHAMGSSRMNVGPSFSPNPTLRSHELPDSVVQGSNDLDRRFDERSQIGGFFPLNKAMDVGEIAMGTVELKNSHAIPSNDNTGSSLDGSPAPYSQNKAVQTSQNMLELLHKVGKSRNSNSLAAPDVSEQAGLDHQQLNQPSSLQGCGLRLGPPSQRQPSSAYSMSGRTFDHNQLDYEVGNKDQTQFTSASPSQTLRSIQATSQRENLGSRSSMSEQTRKETFSHNEANPPSAVVSDSSYRYQQQNSDASGHELTDKSLNYSFGNQNNPSSSHSKRPPSSSSLSQVGTLDRQLPVIDTLLCSQPSIPSMPQQAGSSTMFKNVWTNITAAQQRVSGALPNKITPNVLQSMILSSNTRDASIWGLQKLNDQGKKQDNAQPDVATGSTSSQNQDERQDQGSSAMQSSSEKADDGLKKGILSQGQELLGKHPLDGSSAVSISSLVRLHQQDVSKEKCEEDLSVNTQAVNTSLSNAVGNTDVGLHGSASQPPVLQQKNYSLLHQIQTMKGAELDPSNRFGKRLKGPDFDPDASQKDWKAGQRVAYGQNTLSRVPVDGKVGASSQASISSDIKMLSFASRDKEARSASGSPMLSGREAYYHDIHAAQRQDLQNRVYSVNANSEPNEMGGSEQPKISPQMAPSWFGQYGPYRNGETPAIYGGQRTPTQQYNFPKVVGRMDNVIAPQQRPESGQVGTLGRSMESSKVPTNELSLQSSDITDHAVAVRPKKRKTATAGLQSWHKVIGGHQRLRNSSMAELDWAHSSNRLIEKVEDDAEMLEDGPSVAQPRKRLILTTQLTQQLIPAAPASVLKAQASSAYEGVTYNVAKVALGDACNRLSLSGSSSCQLLDKGCSVLSGLNQNMEKLGDQFISKVVEDYIERSKRLESDFGRLDKRTSMLDIRLECQELERFSIVNRLGKFHGRSRTDGVEASSTSENPSLKTFPQRYVTVLPMARNIPEGVSCFNL